MPSADREHCGCSADAPAVDRARPRRVPTGRAGLDRDPVVDLAQTHADDALTGARAHIDRGPAGRRPDHPLNLRLRLMAHRTHVDR